MRHSLCLHNRAFGTTGCGCEALIVLLCVIGCVWDCVLTGCGVRVCCGVRIDLVSVCVWVFVVLGWCVCMCVCCCVCESV